MRKTKKLVALVLAMVFVVAFMAMSASAATTEIQPRGVVCDCGSSNTRTINYGYVKTSTYEVNGCPEYPAVGHNHIVYKELFEFKCYTCGENYTYYGSSYTTCE